MLRLVFIRIVLSLMLMTELGSRENFFVPRDFSSQKPPSHRVWANFFKNLNPTRVDHFCKLLNKNEQFVTKVQKISPRFW